MPIQPFLVYALRRLVLQKCQRVTDVQDLTTSDVIISRVMHRRNQRPEGSLLIFVTESYALFIVLALLGTILISTFTVTIVMAQTLLPRHLGIASGLMVGFAIGAGGLFVTLLGVVADHFGVPVALKSIMILPLIGFILCLILSYPEQKNPKF